MTDRWRVRRRLMYSLVLVAVGAAVLAVVSWTGVANSGYRPSTDTRTTIEAAARAAVEAVLTVDPDRPDPTSVRSHLAEPLLTRYTTAGADVALPGAVANRVRLSVTVVALAVEDYDTDRARVLAFVDQDMSGAATAPAAPRASTATPADGHVSSEKWLVMSRVDRIWLLADMTSVGDITR